jgi:hypothetical protein
MKISFADLDHGFQNVCEQSLLDHDDHDVVLSSEDMERVVLADFSNQNYNQPVGRF